MNIACQARVLFSRRQAAFGRHWSKHVTCIIFKMYTLLTVRRTVQLTWLYHSALHVIYTYLYPNTTAEYEDNKNMAAHPHAQAQCPHLCVHIIPRQKIVSLHQYLFWNWADVVDIKRLQLRLWETNEDQLHSMLLVGAKHKHMQLHRDNEYKSAHRDNCHKASICGNRIQSWSTQQKSRNKWWVLFNN